MSAPPSSRLSIGQLAQLAGVTPRAIRHYHATGLLPEPDRDGSGYRRYGPAELIALVRIVRLRSLGLPIAQIANHVGSAGGADLAEDLSALAGELDAEIERLTALRDRLVEAARSRAPIDADAALRDALRAHGRLGAADLNPDEAKAAQLVDALHPRGVAGALDDANELLTGSALRPRLDALLTRYRALADTTSDTEIDGLADEVAETLPRPEVVPPSVNIELMDSLLGDRLNSGQRRFMHRLRQVMTA
jgi:MerR family transcriptional regulator, thiopeptide resistance regulator